MGSGVGTTTKTFEDIVGRVRALDERIADLRQGAGSRLRRPTG